MGKGLASNIMDYNIGWYVTGWTPGVTVLSNGSYTNYLVASSDWTNTNDTVTGGAGAGALTWVNGLSGHAFGESGVGASVSAGNSLVGNLAGDGVGLQTLSLQRTVGNSSVATGDLMSISNIANCDAGVGAITLIPGATGMAGPVSWRNSIIGLAPASAGLNSNVWDGYSSYMSDIKYAMLPTPVTSAEQVQYRPLVWVAPNASSGANATHAMALTVVAESASAPTTADQVNTGGNANWASSLFAGNGAGFNGVGGNTGSGLLGFASNTGSDVVITPTALTGLLDGGTNVTLQANNDITVLKPVTTSAGGNGGDLTLEAGRTIHLQANITTDNGNFTATANKSVASGVADADCNTCVAQIVMTPGTSINAGTGNISLTVLNSTDKTSNAAGNIVLDDLSGANISVVNQGVDGSGHGMGIRFNDGATIGTSATQALTLQARGSSAQGGSIVLAGDTVLQGASNGQLNVGASDTSLSVGLGSGSGGWALLGSEVGAIIKQSVGFNHITFGRTDQAGATTIAGMNFTSASMLRSGSNLDVDLTLQGGSGGVTTSGTLTSGEATGKRLELAVTNGTLNFGASSTQTATNGILELSALGSGSITQSATDTLNATLLQLNGTGSFNLTTGSNTIGTLAGNVGSALVKTASSTLTVGSVGGVDGFTATSGMRLQAAGASSDLILNKAVSNGSGDIVLAAGRNFTNNLATDTGINPGSGRYLVYSTNPTGSLEGMSSYSKHYNQTFTAGSTPAYAGSGNWFLYTIAPTISASVSAGSTTTYGASASAPGVNLSGFIDGDTSATATSGALAFSMSSYTPSGAGYIPVGTYTLNLTGVGTYASALGYQISVTPGSSSLTVQPKAISASGLSANSKIYDGTTATTVSGTATLLGGGSTSGDGMYMTGDTVAVSGTATGAFGDRHAGIAKSVTLSGLTLSGGDAGNYTISANSVTADITPKAITVSGLSAAASKVYDGSNSASVSGTAALLAAESAGTGSTSDGKRYTGDTISLSGTASGTYNSKNVAQANLVTFGGLTLSGAQAGDYTLTFGTQAATITAKALNVSGLTAASRAYDSTTTASLSGSAALTGGGSTSGDGRYIGSDVVSVAGTPSGSFGNANAGIGKTVTVSGLTLAGADAGNYSLTPFSTTANITARSIAVTADDKSKTYGDTDPTLTFQVGGAGLVGSDTAASVFSGSLSTTVGAAATAGTHAISQGSLAVSSSNYSLSSFANGTLTVGKAALTVTADDKSKTYGDTDPSLSYTVNASQL
ncbi:MAG: hypothetical protein HGA47_07525, partial [Zoogloea sp.]|nr:hypothetical protein [Zoogloea sp.]